MGVNKQAMMMVKHRRWGETDSRSVDEHMVLLAVGLSMYNTAVSWESREKGATILCHSLDRPKSVKNMGRSNS